jgi:hypothetical protein
VAIWGCDRGAPGVKKTEPHELPEATANPTHFFDFHINNIENPQTEAYKKRGSAQAVAKWAKEGKLSDEQKAKAIAALEKNIPTTEDADLKSHYTTALDTIKGG